MHIQKAPIRLALLALAVAPGLPLRAQQAARATVDAVIRPLMRRYQIPGMAVGLLANGKPYVFNYGLADVASHRPVTRSTLFELGSASKTFTVTLASYAQVTGRLRWTDPVSEFLPSLRGSAFGRVPLLDLATHTPGGLPLQVPAGVRTDAQLFRYLRAWRPAYPPGTMRTYSNIGIGLLGLIAARSLHGDFSTMLRRDVLAPLGLRNTFLAVPAARMSDYAEGYTAAGRPIRVVPGELAAEAYGLKSTAADMLRFLAANLGVGAAPPHLSRAIAATHIGYFRAPGMTQDLIWEQVSGPPKLPALLQANSDTLLFRPVPVRRLDPPQPAPANAWLNKTGSTNGFGAYVALIPSRRLALVLLANKSYPIPARVTAAYQILTRLRP